MDFCHSARLEIYQVLSTSIATAQVVVFMLSLIFVGKFGVMHSLSTSNLTFGGVISGDPNPPIVANYGKSDLISNVWSSVVLHCPIVNLSAGYTNPAILCAKLVPTNLPSTVNTPAIVSNQQNLSLNLEGEFAAFLTVPGTNGSFIVKIDGTGQPYLQYHNFSPSHFEDLTFLGVGSYYWNFNLTGLKTLSSTDVTNIIENGIKCKFIDGCVAFRFLKYFTNTIVIVTLSQCLRFNQ